MPRLITKILVHFLLELCQLFCFHRLRLYAVPPFLQILSKVQQEEIHMLFALKERGQGLVEYALILVLVAIVVIAVLMILGPTIGNVFSKVNKSLSGV